MKSRCARYSPKPLFAASDDELLRDVVRGAGLRLVLRVEDDHRDVDEAARVDRDQACHVVEAGLVDVAAQQVAELERIAAGRRADRREADVTPFLAAVPAGHVVPAEVRHAALDQLAGMLELRDVCRSVFLTPHLGVGDTLERFLDLPEPVVDDGLVAVERETHHPASDLELTGHPVDHRLGNRVGAVVPLVAAREHGAEQDRVQDLRVHPDRVLEGESAERVDQRPEVVVLPHAAPERHVDLRLGHQPDAHLRHDPEVRLHEELIGRRAEPALVEVPRAVALHRAHARPHQLAVREHDLHPARRGRPVDAVGHVRRAVVERVADDAAPAEICNREHELVAAGLDRLVEVEPADTGLDDRVGGLLVDLEHAVHAPQADDHGAADPRRGAAVTVVAALPDRPERHLVLVRHPDDLLNLLDRLRHDHRGGRVLVPGRIRERVAELPQLVFTGEDVLGSDGGGKALEGPCQLLLRNTWRENGAHAITSVTGLPGRGPYRTSPARNSSAWRTRSEGRSNGTTCPQPSSSRYRQPSIAAAVARAAAAGTIASSSPCTSSTGARSVPRCPDRSRSAMTPQSAAYPAGSLAAMMLR